MDLIHKLTNIVDHNRGTVAGFAVLLSGFLLGSCGAFDGKVVSSTSGKSLDQDGLKAEYITTSADLQRRYDDGSELIRRGQAVHAEVERDSERLNASYIADSDLAAVEVANRNDLSGQAGQLVTAATGVQWLLPLISIGTSATAAGALYDNRRKDKKIKENKAQS